RNADLLAIADDIIAAHRAGHLEALGRGAFLADEVDDRLGALAARHLENGFDLVAVCLHELVGADLLGELERGFRLVDHDDVGCRHGAQALDADVPEPTGADHDAAFAGIELAGRLLHRPIGGQARVRIGRDVLRSEGLRQRHDVALGGAQILGVAAVGIEPGKLAGPVHVEASPAGETGSAGDLGMDDHRVADLDALDLLADRLDPARVLVAHDQWQELVAGRVGVGPPDALDDVQVRPADPGAADPDDDVRRLLDLRIGNRLFGDPLLRGQRIVVAFENLGLHGRSSFCSAFVGLAADASRAKLAPGAKPNDFNGVSDAWRHEPEQPAAANVQKLVIARRFPPPLHPVQRARSCRL